MPDETATMTLMIPFQRDSVDTEKREVWGWAASENLASDGMMLSHDSNVAAFAEWFPRGNVREMHAPSAIGRAIAYEPDDAGKRVWCGVRISRGAEDAWQKVLDGTYQGFSVKGDIVKRETKIVERSGKKQAVPYVTEWRMKELSIVDAASDPGSGFVSIVRGEGTEAPTMQVADTIDEGAVTAPEGMAFSAPQAPPETEPETVQRAMDDVDEDGNPDPTPDASDELVDALGAQQAIDIVNQLIAREAAEQAAGGGDESWDIDLLTEAKQLLSWFQMGERDQAIAYMARRKEGETAMTELTTLTETVSTLVERMAAIETSAAEIQRSASPLEGQLTELAGRVNALEEQPRDRSPMARIERAMKTFPGESAAEGEGNPAAAFAEIRRAMPAHQDAIDRLEAEMLIRQAAPVTRRQ